MRASVHGFTALREIIAHGFRRRLRQRACNGTLLLMPESLMPPLAFAPFRKWPTTFTIPA
jgi:hypothetical protein